MLQTYATEERSVIQLSLPTSMLQRITTLALTRKTNRSALIRDAIIATYFTPLTDAGASAIKQWGQDDTRDAIHDAQY